MDGGNGRLEPVILDLPALNQRSRDLDALEVKAPLQEEARVSSSDTVRVLEQKEEDGADWESIADRAIPGEALLSSQQQVVSRTSNVNPLPQETLKRRGRGSFLYQKSCLYSDQPDFGTTSANTSRAEDEVEGQEHGIEDVMNQVRDLKFCIGHVLVLYDFPPSTRTIDLEKLFEVFQDRGFAIRWINDITALAVFRTPAIAHEAQISISCPFNVRLLDETDNLFMNISSKDLEPPLPRPKTSARTAQRLIAQGMGIKFSTNFGSNELRKQEEARKNRIQSRHIMKDDAWGSDNP